MVVLRGNEDKAIEGIDLVGPCLDLLVVVLLVSSAWDNWALQQWNVKFLQVHQLILNAGVAALS